LQKDFYKVLEIQKEADPAKIKKAYRKAAKRYHPDVSPKGEEKFKEIQEAYETLSDSRKKAVYDRKSLEKTFRPIPKYRPSESIHPLFNFLDDFGDLFASFGHVWNKTLVDFLNEEEGRAVRVEILLTPREARSGRKLSLTVPLWGRCSRCRGTGFAEGLICGLCRGEGKEKIEKKIKITIPAGIKNGTEIKIPLAAPAVKGEVLIATIRVSP
jgi:molecular chaperone DnaJ